MYFHLDMLHWKKLFKIYFLYLKLEHVFSSFQSIGCFCGNIKADEENRRLFQCVFILDFRQNMLWGHFNHWCVYVCICSQFKIMIFAYKCTLVLDSMIFFLTSGTIMGAFICAWVLDSVSNVLPLHLIHWAKWEHFFFHKNTVKTSWSLKNTKGHFSTVGSVVRYIPKYSSYYLNDKLLA